MKILSALYSDASVSVPKLSKQLGVNLSVTYSRIKRLQKRGVIEKFTVQVNEESLGMRAGALAGLNIDPKQRETVLEEIEKIEGQAHPRGHRPLRHPGEPEGEVAGRAAQDCVRRHRQDAGRHARGDLHGGLAQRPHRSTSGSQSRALIGGVANRHRPRAVRQRFIGSFLARAH